MSASSRPGASVVCDGLCRDYTGGTAEVPALVDASFEIASGETLAIVGRSGSGKSTLVQLLGLLDRPDAGDVVLNGVSTSALDDAARAKVRGFELGFVFQAFHLRQYQTVLENVMVGLLYQRVAASERTGRALGALGQVGLEDKASRHPNELSGGERQRVAIARAIARRPSLLVADEPTGNLDRRNGDLVFAALVANPATVVVVTHDPELAGRCDRILQIDEGRVLGG